MDLRIYLLLSFDVGFFSCGGEAKEMGSIPKQKPHAVCIPYPAQGHVNPMLKLAKLLHRKGFHITFVLTHYNANRLRRSRGPDALSGLPSFVFDFIPDGLPPAESEDATQDIPSLCASTRKHSLGPFKELLRRLNAQTAAANPPVSCIVSDGVMSFTLDAAEELGLPEVIFWTTSACGFLGYAQYAPLRKHGFIPLKDESQLTNGYLDTVVDCLPGMDNIRLKDLPSFLRTTDPEDFMSEFVSTESIRAERASAIILNTFSPLESKALSALQAQYSPPVFYVGPLHLMAADTNDDTHTLGSNLWKEDARCIDWLDTRSDKSVVYVNFGSITVMTANQLLEFAWGLANSQQSFLWVIRPDLVAGDTAVLPAEFAAATEGRGLMVDWCPQEQVLAHPAVGGFLSHSGWNSTIESIGAGVPMVCWPFFAEQQTNCRYSCVEWGIGMEIDSDVRREVVERQVRELMVGEKGDEMRRKAVEWKIAAEAATKVATGSSCMSLDKLVEQVLVNGHS
uniref:Glycosyltransferase n=1 Tax=Kalanchoe fedtschenkoi TaxID=63787 RepID=A0A7N0ZSR1_KALFE